jgi:hypothetical protein
MITLMVDKYALVKVGFSMQDLIFQIPRQSTPCKISSLKSLAPPKWHTAHRNAPG